MSDHYEVVPITLYSLLRQRLAACRQLKNQSKQWIGAIRNLQNTGVSATEIEYSNLLPYLDGQEPARPIQLDELISILDGAASCDLVLQRRVKDDYGPTIHYERQPIPSSRPKEEIRHGRREIRYLRYRERSFGFCIWWHIELETGLFGQLRYWSFSVPHGRKHLPAFDNDSRFATLSEALAYGRRLAARMAKHFENRGLVGPSKPLGRYQRYSLPLGDQYSEWLITVPNLPVSYIGPHFDIRNLVAHVRTTTRIATDGKRLLVLEEIQSDWNQELRKAINNKRRLQELNQYRSDQAIDPELIASPPMNPYLNHWMDVALRMMLVLAVYYGFAGIAWLPGDLHAERFYWADENGLKSFYDRIVPMAFEKLVKPWGVILSETQVTTLSRRFGVRISDSATKWQVRHLASRRAIGDEFSDQDKAEAFRQSKEIEVLESVPCLLLSSAMRTDIRENGLPYLGAIRAKEGS